MHHILSELLCFFRGDYLALFIVFTQICIYAIRDSTSWADMLALSAGSWISGLFGSFLFIVHQRSLLRTFYQLLPLILGSMLLVIPRFCRVVPLLLGLFSGGYNVGLDNTRRRSNLKTLLMLWVLMEFTVNWPLFPFRCWPTIPLWRGQPEQLGSRASWISTSVAQRAHWLAIVLSFVKIIFKKNAW